MARFNFGGIAELENILLREADGVEEIADKMLEAGAKVLVKAHTASAEAMLHRRTGSLAGSIASSKTKKNEFGRYRIVYPQGNQPHGNPKAGQKGEVRNAQVGFTLEYGRKQQYGTSAMPPRPWMETANRQAEGAVLEAMEKAWEEKHG